MGRQGPGGGQVQPAPRGVAAPLKAWKGLLKIYALARHFNVSNIQTICLKENKLLPRSKGTEAPWSRPSMFLLTAVFQCRLKIDFITITFLIKAWICFPHNHSSLPSSEWRWHNIWESALRGRTDSKSVRAMWRPGWWRLRLTFGGRGCQRVPKTCLVLSSRYVKIILLWRKVKKQQRRGI